MKAQKEFFDGNTLRRARRAVEKKETITFKDISCPGLAIRVQNGTAGWYLIDRKFKRRIDALGAFSTEDLPHLRGIVSRARAIAKEGGDPGPILRHAVTSDTPEEAENAAAVKAGAWVWEDLRDAWLATIKANNPETTYTSYRSNTGAVPGGALEPDLAHIAGKPVVAITAHDIRRVRNSILERGKDENGRQVSHVRQANHVLSNIRKAFRWGCEHYELSGLEQNPGREVEDFKLPKKLEVELKAEKPEKRPLTQLEVGKVIQAIEKWPNPQMRLALMIQVMTGQRIESVISAPASEFVDVDDANAPYKIIWRIGSDKVASRRGFPLPYFAEVAVQQARQLMRPDNRYLFPQQRPRKKGDPMIGPMSKRPAQKVWDAAQDEETGGLLDSCEFRAGTHDMRRAFISHMMSEWRIHKFMGPSAPDLITHAHEGRTKTSELVYNLDQASQEKWRIMLAWQRFVNKGYEYALEGINAEEARRRYIDWRLKKEEELGLLVL